MKNFSRKAMQDEPHILCVRPLKNWALNTTIMHKFCWCREDQRRLCTITSLSTVTLLSISISCIKWTQETKSARYCHRVRIAVMCKVKICTVKRNICRKNGRTMCWEHASDNRLRSYIFQRFQREDLSIHCHIHNSCSFDINRNSALQITACVNLSTDQIKSNRQNASCSPPCWAERRKLVPVIQTKEFSVVVQQVWWEKRLCDLKLQWIALLTRNKTHSTPKTNHKEQSNAKKKAGGMDEKLLKKVSQARQGRAYGEECPLESRMWGRPTFQQPLTGQREAKALKRVKRETG